LFGNAKKNPAGPLVLGPWFLVLRPAKHHPHSRCGYGYGAGTMTLSSGSGTCSRPRIAYSLNRECEIPNSRENSEKTKKKKEVENRIQTHWRVDRQLRGTRNAGSN